MPSRRAAPPPRPHPKVEQRSNPSDRGPQRCPGSAGTIEDDVVGNSRGRSSQGWRPAPAAPEMTRPSTAGTRRPAAARFSTGQNADLVPTTARQARCRRRDRGRSRRAPVHGGATCGRTSLVRPECPAYGGRRVDRHGREWAPSRDSGGSCRSIPEPTMSTPSRERVRLRATRSRSDRGARPPRATCRPCVMSAYPAPAEAQQCRVAGHLGRQCGRHTGVHDPHARVRMVGEHVDRRAAAEEVHDHLRGHRLRVRRDTLCDHAVIPGRDDDESRVEPGAFLPADRRDARREVLEAAERSRGVW